MIQFQKSKALLAAGAIILAFMPYSCSNPVFAACRSGGFHCRWDESQRCKVKQNFGRDKAAILANCPLWEVDFLQLTYQFLFYLTSVKYSVYRYKIKHFFSNYRLKLISIFSHIVKLIEAKVLGGGWASLTMAKLLFGRGLAKRCE